MQLSQIIRTLNVAYPNVLQYIKESNKSEHIIDTDAGYSDFTTDSWKSGFDIVNKSNVFFCLLQIDNKLIVSHKGGQCDSAFFYDDNINLLEFKTNAYSKACVKKNWELYTC